MEGGGGFLESSVNARVLLILRAGVRSTWVGKSSWSDGDYYNVLLKVFVSCKAKKRNVKYIG